MADGRCNLYLFRWQDAAMQGPAVGLPVRLLKIRGEQLSARLQMPVDGSHCPGLLPHTKIQKYQTSPYLTSLPQNNKYTPVSHYYCRFSAQLELLRPIPPIGDVVVKTDFSITKGKQHHQHNHTITGNSRRKCKEFMTSENFNISFHINSNIHCDVTFFSSTLTDTGTNSMWNVSNYKIKLSFATASKTCLISCSLHVSAFIRGHLHVITCKHKKNIKVTIRYNGSVESSCKIKDKLL
jgi:hypothetical protein